MTRLLAIDPGNTESAYVLINHDYEPMHFDKIDNKRLRTRLLGGYEDVDADRTVIEMVESYGMPVGAEVFETCVWIGRFAEAVRSGYPYHDPELIKRRPVRLHHCHSTKATDATVSQALKDRFAKGVRNHGKGTKNDPGFFYGFYKDIWQAYALAVYAMDTAEGIAA